MKFCKKRATQQCNDIAFHRIGIVIRIKYIKMGLTPLVVSHIKTNAMPANQNG